MTTFYVGWTDDLRGFQLLGSYDSLLDDENEASEDAIKQAAINHGKTGRYIAMPAGRLIQKDVPEFSIEPVIVDPPPPSPTPTV